MKVFILFLFLFLCYTNVSAGKLVQYGAAVCLRALDCPPQLRNLDLDVSKIDVYFYDFRNGVYRSSFPVDKAAQGILSIIHNNKHQSIRHRNKAKKLFMYVGGFKSHINETTTARMINTFRKIYNSYLIIVDHSVYTHDKDGTKNSYERSVKYVPNIGKKLANMLADLKAGGGRKGGGDSLKTIHCIGHSLGGQILGYVGENYKTRTGQKISRITALDPAGPCFFDKLDHVRSGIADYVEIYHCNAGVLGSKKLLGNVDFFVNNGKSQPECGNPSLFSPSKAIRSCICSHNTCVMIWTASVLHRNWYPASRCQKHKHFKRDKCSRNINTTAGYWNPGTATGKYYFSTDGYNYNF